MANEKLAQKPSEAHTGLAKRSCHACLLRKRRCTRELPGCGLCIRRRRTCSYAPRAQHGEQPSSLSDLKPGSDPTQTRDDFHAAASILDPTLAQACKPWTATRLDIRIPTEIDDILGGVEARKALVVEYYKTADRWLPIISRTRLYASLCDLMHRSDPDVIVTLLALKLAVAQDAIVDPCSKVYQATKEFHLRMEMAGHLSVHYLQSLLLVAMYELGHAIYPSAFTTIAMCARHAIALGINETLLVHGKAWIEQEERNRTWWAVLILDRYVNLSFHGRHLCTPDPDVSTILPVDEEAWEQGVLPKNHAPTLVSTPRIDNGRYARLAQATSLLSQVFRHTSSQGATQRDGLNQLERTLFALEQLASAEEHERQICCLSSIAICYSAILILQGTKLDAPGDGKDSSYLTIRTVTDRTLSFFQRCREGWGALERFPPLALDWFYRITLWHVFLSHNLGLSEWMEEINEQKDALHIVSQRWRAASYYLRLLEIRESTKIPL